MDTRRRFCCCGGHPCKEALHKLHRADDCARERRALNNSLVTASDTRTADHFDILGQRPRARVDTPPRQSHKLEKRRQRCDNVVGNLGCGQPVYAREERIARVMRDRGGAAANRAARHQPLCRPAEYHPVQTTRGVQWPSPPLYCRRPEERSPSRCIRRRRAPPAAPQKVSGRGNKVETHIERRAGRPQCSGKRALSVGPGRRGGHRLA